MGARRWFSAAAAQYCSRLYSGNIEQSPLPHADQPPAKALQNHSRSIAIKYDPSTGSIESNSSVTSISVFRIVPVYLHLPYVHCRSNCPLSPRHARGLRVENRQEMTVLP